MLVLALIPFNLPASQEVKQAPTVQQCRADQRMELALVDSPMKLNWRHKAGLFPTLVAVGCGLFLESSAKQAVAIALLRISFAWLIGSVAAFNSRSSSDNGPNLTSSRLE